MTREQLQPTFKKTEVIGIQAAQDERPTDKKTGVGTLEKTQKLHPNLRIKILELLIKGPLSTAELVSYTGALPRRVADAVSSLKQSGIKIENDSGKRKTAIYTIKDEDSKQEATDLISKSKPPDLEHYFTIKDIAAHTNSPVESVRSNIRRFGPCGTQDVIKFDGVTYVSNEAAQIIMARLREIRAKKPSPLSNGKFLVLIPKELSSYKTPEKEEQEREAAKHVLCVNIINLFVNRVHLSNGKLVLTDIDNNLKKIIANHLPANIDERLTIQSRTEEEVYDFAIPLITEELKEILDKAEKGCSGKEIRIRRYFEKLFRSGLNYDLIERLIKKHFLHAQNTPNPQRNS